MFTLVFSITSMQTSKQLKICSEEDMAIWILARLAKQDNLHSHKFSHLVLSSLRATILPQTVIFKALGKKSGRPGKYPKNTYPGQSNFYNAFFKPQKE